MTSNTTRPDLNLPDSGADEPIGQLVAALQLGYDIGDADQYDSAFAADILWGTPKGQWLAGYADLNAAHRRMMRGVPIEPRSRFELVQKVQPALGVVVTQIRRTALNGGFSEVAMYVLVKHDDRWWLAAAQNTPVTDALPAVGPA
ncbi:nuclear transport factor 2 family protein [Tsukamurella pulmonis]|uniref:nuclear transport factor 2 family protein n=1 Tax=Tsukamurella pulmonis TaxID=47312 RepID=UPI000E08F64E|nr:nuclear transport factor 2 family protein [Tsukamurella pulmonis]RDH13410.1 nuclear transport factor 2 family protein [Tsukamurella pulmonis]